MTDRQLLLRLTQVCDNLQNLIDPNNMVAPSPSTILDALDTILALVNALTNLLIVDDDD